MTEDNYRTIFAIAGLAIGLGIMFALQMGGMIPGALFGAGGAVIGGIVGERYFAKKR